MNMYWPELGSEDSVAEPKLEVLRDLDRTSEAPAEL